MAQDAFAGKVAIVTGAASGIGRALALELARRGARVWLADLDGEEARRAASSAQSASAPAQSASAPAQSASAPAQSGLAHAAELDVTDAAAFEALVAGVVQEAGRLDLLVNNAGLMLHAEARLMSLADWERLLDVNLRGTIHGVAAAYPRMVAQQSGHIVNMASAAGLVPLPWSAAYATTKHAVVGLSTALRLEAALHGVKVSAVCPGRIDTPIFERMKVLGARGEAARTESRGGSMALAPAVQEIVRGIERNRALTVFPRKARLLWTLYRLAPGPIGRMLGEWARRDARPGPR